MGLTLKESPITAITTLAPPASDEAATAPAVPPETLLVTGNPNVGKSVVFGWLTGRYASVSNYPGTTVMVTRGTVAVDGWQGQVCDTPGLNTLLAASEDELAARELLLGEPSAVVLQVGETELALDRGAGREIFVRRATAGASGL